MIIARNARELTDKAIQNEIESRKERAIEFCNTEITKQIELAASEKRSSVTITVAREIYSLTVGILKDNGYTVTMLNNTQMSIIW